MPTPLELLNAQRRGVTIYSPGRPVPTRRPVQTGRVAPRQTVQQRGQQGPVDWAALTDKVLNTPTAQKARQETAQKEAESQAYDQLPWYKKGLGMVLGNPVARNVLVPLGALGTFGKGVTLATETAAEAIEDRAPALWKIIQAGGGALGSVDIDRVKADERTLREKLSPTSDYGFGQLLDPDQPSALNKGLGFTYDMLLDPLNYVAPGATRVTNVALRSAKALELAEAAAKAEKLLAHADELKALGKFDEAAQAGTEAGRAFRTADEAKNLLDNLKHARAPVAQGRKARAAQVAELAQHNPALIERYGKELESAAQRGFNTIRDPVLRAELGLEDPALRWAGQRLPGTRRLTQRGAVMGGAVRAAADKTPIGALGAKFFPRGLEEPLGTLTRGKGGDTLRAATAVRIQNLMRRGAGNYEGRANKDLTGLVRQLRKAGGEDEIRVLMRQAETDPGRNLLNDFFGHKLPDLYEKIAGRPMGVSANRDTYIPHMMTPEWRRFVQALKNDGEDIVEDLGFQADDMLEASKYLEKSRKLKPDVIGEPKDFDIGGRVITLTDGTIDELNEELARVFPEFTGKAYMDDPAMIGEAYVSSVARQAGRDLALNEIAKSPNPLVREISGELQQAIEARNKWGRTNPVTDVIKKGYTKGQRLVPAGERPERPTTAFDDMLASTLHVDETQRARDLVKNEGQEFVEQVGADVKAGRKSMADTLGDLRKTLNTGLRTKLKITKADLKALNTTLGGMDAEINKLGPLLTDNVDDITAMATMVEAKQATLKAKIKKIRDRYGKKIPRDQQRIQRELEAALRHLEDQAQRIQTKYLKGPVEIRAEVDARRAALEEPIRRAEKILQDAEADLISRSGHVPMQKERVQEANAYLRTFFDTEDDFDAQRQLYLDAIHQMREEGAPILYRVNGRVTDETTDAVTKIVTEDMAAAAPPAAAPEPAAAAPPTMRDAITTQKRKELNQQYKDAVANGDEALATQIEAQLDALKTAAAAPAPAPAPAAAAATPEIPPEAMAPTKAPPGGWKDGEGKKIRAPRKPIPTYTDGRFTLHADPHPRYSGWGIKQYRLNPIPGQPPFTWMQGKTFATAEEATGEIEEMVARVGGWKVGEEPRVTRVTQIERRPVVVDKSKKLSDGSNTYSVYDGVDSYTIRKNDDNQWIVSTNGKAQADNGYRTLKQAEDAINSGKHVGAEPPAAPAVPEAVVPPPPPEVAPPPAPTPPAAAPEVAAPAPTYKWKKVAKSDAVRGPEGWIVQPYQPINRATEYGVGTVPVPDPTLAQRYIAINKTGERLGNQSFATIDEAKAAVEQLVSNPPRRRMTPQELANASSKRGAPPVAATYENLSGEIPPVAGGPPRGAVTPQRERTPVPTSHWSTRGEGPPQYGPMSDEDLARANEVAGLRPEGPPRNVAPKADDPFYVQRQAWKDAEARAVDPTLTEAERKAAEREARTLGGAFTQKQGKYYSREEAYKVVIEDQAWEAARAADPAVQKATADLNKEIDRAGQQVEAMVYVREHNPETGTETLRRLPAGSTEGFGEGTRQAVPIEVPRTGEVPMGTRPQPKEWSSKYTDEMRASDRAILESGVEALMDTGRRTEYQGYQLRSLAAAERLDTAANNETLLNMLDRDARRAYTDEVKAADAAVTEAKRAEAAAYQDVRDGGVANASVVYEEAKRNTQRVIAEQTDARQAWMEADRLWKQALDQREQYRKIQGEVSSAERIMVDTFKGKDSGIATRAAREGKPYPFPTASVERRKAYRDMVEAYQKLDAADQAGMTFLEESERRQLVGQMNAMDVEKRRLINETYDETSQRSRENMVKGAHEVLEPPGYSASASANITNYQGAPGIPPVRGTGQEDLTARAYAEQFQPTEPGNVERIVMGSGRRPKTVGRPSNVPEEVAEALADPETIMQTGQVGQRQVPGEFYAAGQTNVRPYNPRTEREAIGALERQATSAEEFARSEAGKALELEEAGLTKEIDSKKAQAVIDAAESEILLRTERDQTLLPIQKQAETYTVVHKALHDKPKLLAQRTETQAQLDALKSVPLGQKADFAQSAADIGAVARQNPDMLDDDLAVTEALLQDAADTAAVLVDNDLTRGQVQKAIDNVGNPKDHSLDVMLTTVGRNWRMIYEANGTKKAILKPDDLIVQADLHRMFTNLYEIKKDSVLAGRTINAFTNLFKTYATLTPGFHIRNAISAVFMNTTDGVALKTQLEAAGLWREYMKAEDGEAWLAKQGQQVYDAFEVAFGTGAGGRFTEAGFAQGGGRNVVARAVGRATNNPATRLSQRAGVRVEGSVRLAMSLDSMRLGQDIETAIQRVNRIHFDYGEVSKLDENMKRLIPFWTFMSRNMPMQVSQMWTHPKVYLAYEDFVRNFSAKDEEYTPEYWTEAGAWNTGLKMPGFIPESYGGGTPIYLSPDLGYNRLKADLDDYEQFLSLRDMGGVLSQGNPAFTGPAEYAFRKDIFTGRQFEEGETVPVGGPLGFPYKLIAKAFGKEEGGEVDAAFMNLIRAVNPLADRSVRLAPQQSGNDPESKKRQIESLLRFGVGAPVRTLTPRQQQSEAFNRYYDQLDALKQDQARQQRQAG